MSAVDDYIHRSSHLFGRILDGAAEIRGVVIRRYKKSRMMSRERAAGEAGEHQGECVDESQVVGGHCATLFWQAHCVQCAEPLVQVGIGPVGWRFLQLTAEGGAMIRLQDDQRARVGPREILQQSTGRS
jgi:hypothetical protein